MYIDYALPVVDGDHHELPSGPVLPGLLGYWGVRVFPMGTLSLGIWIITEDPALITGYERLKDIWI